MKHKDRTPAPLEETSYGFQWGPLKVQREMHIETETGHRVVLTLETQRETVRAYVTPKGYIKLHNVKPKNKKE